MKYDKRDRIIIENLYHNWRMSSSELARKTRLSRRKVDYRIKQYLSSEMIRTFFTVFNYAKLGFRRPAYLFLSLKNKEDIPKIGKYLEKTKRCTSWGKAWTEYDIFSNFIFKNKREMKNFIVQLKKTFHDKISKITLIDPIYAEFYPLKTIGNSLSEPYLLTNREVSKIKLDALYFGIMKQVSKDARKPIVDIANNLKISPERVLYMIRNLIKKGVILGSRIQFNLEKVGYFATCLFIKTELNQNTLVKLKTLCKEASCVNYLIVSNKEPEIIIQIFHKDEFELRQIVRKVDLLLEKNTFKISIVELEDDMNVINPLPFLK